MASLVGRSFCALQGTLLSPFFTGSLLLALIYSPQLFGGNSTVDQDGISQTRLHSFAGASTVRTILLALFAIGSTIKVNRKLDSLSRNSWRATPNRAWNWPTEIAVVTGGSSGIGMAIVEELAALGVNVAILDVQEPPKSLAEHSKINFFRCDVTDLSSVKAAAESVRQKLGNPTILVNNAGIGLHTAILELPEKILRKIMNVNLIALWFTTQEFLPHMVKENKGHILTTASVASFIAAPYGSAYYASKAGAMAFHESLTEEIKHLHKAINVLTTIIHPSYVRTPLIHEVEGGLDRQGVGIITTKDVATKVVSQIKKKESGRIIVPEVWGILSLSRSWPDWVQNAVRGILATLLGRV